MRLTGHYILKLTILACENNVVYCRPLAKVPIDPEKPWYASKPCGKNNLGAMVKSVCVDLRIQIIHYAQQVQLPIRSNEKQAASQQLCAGSTAGNCFQATLFVPWKTLDTNTLTQNIMPMQNERVSQVYMTSWNLSAKKVSSILPLQHLQLGIWNL